MPGSRQCSAQARNNRPPDRLASKQNVTRAAHPIEYGKRATRSNPNMFKNRDIPQGFNHPTRLPAAPSERDRWQQENREWWEANPMRYDWQESLGHAELSIDFFREIDRRFFASAEEYLPSKTLPFDALIDFDRLSDLDVLEIGVGNGSHAQLLASHARSFTGIDLTDYAVRSTTARLHLFGLEADIRRMDAERMAFADASFDFIWSWGVIHHTADTAAVLSEMRRVLRPGGRAVVMIYHRGGWSYYVTGGLFRGLLQGGLFRLGSLHKTLQHHTDGAIARFYSMSDWNRLIRPWFHPVRNFVCGQKAELFPLPAGRIKNLLMRLTPNALSRFFTNHLRFGVFLVSILDARD